MKSIFTQIIDREIPGYIVAETADCIAFLDIHPLAIGHTLVVPKQAVAYVFDLHDTVFSELMIFSKKVALGIQKVVPCLRIGMAVVGLEVPHAHIHLIPLHGLYDIDFKKPRLQQSPLALRNIADQLQAAIAVYFPSDPNSASNKKY